MKLKSTCLSLVTLSCLSLTAMAQPTITTSELPVAGTAWITANDTTYLSAILPGGANANWNYSGLQNHGTDTVVFQSAVGTPYAGDFPGANLASYDAASGGWTYFSTNSSGIYLNGAYDPTFGPVTFNPTSLFCPVPFTYNDTRTNNNGLQIIFNNAGTNIRITINSQVNFLADGYGSLTTPAGNYNNVLRVRATDLSTNTIEAELIAGSGIFIPVSTSQSQTTTFRHYRTGTTNSFLLEVTGDSLGTYATGASYLYSTNVGIDEIAGSRASVQPYPNPAYSTVSFPVPVPQDVTAVEVVSMDGRSVRIPVSVSGQRVSFSTDALSNGIYQFRFGTLSGKMTVQH
ncbi:MAG: hypothetical protein RL213_733 [Bacteroidota bacterium]